MIAWKYLDKQKATLNALRDYMNMASIIEITPDEIKNTKMDMLFPRSPSNDGMPRAKEPQIGERVIATGIDKCDVLRNRYRQAKEFMDWFQPAWGQLSSEERFILEEFYIAEGSKTNAIGRVSEKLHVERAQVYRRKDKAVHRLTLFLYGEE